MTNPMPTQDPSTNLMGEASDLTTPPSLPSTSSMEDQLEELKRQQQLQLQRLAYETVPPQSGGSSLANTARMPTGSLQVGTHQSPPGPNAVLMPTDSPQAGLHPSSHVATLNTSLMPAGTSQVGMHPSSGTPISPATGLVLPGPSVGVQDYRTHPPSHTPPPADILSPGSSVGLVDCPAANQALLDLHMLLQPPSGGGDLMSGMAMPLQLESSITPDPRVDSVETTHPEIGQTGEPMRLPEPAHLQFQTMGGLPPIPAVGSSQLPAPLMVQSPPFSLNGGIEGPGNQAMDPHGIELPAPLNQTSPQPLQFLSLDRGAQDANESIPPNFSLSPRQADGVASTSQMPGSSQSNADSASLTSVNGSFGSVDNTMTITSISRPIPTPGLIPPTSPSQKQEPDIDSPHQSGLELERDASTSMENTSIHPGQLTGGFDSSTYSGQLDNLSQGLAEGGHGFSPGQIEHGTSTGLGTNPDLVGQDFDRGHAEHGTSTALGMPPGRVEQGANTNFPPDSRIDGSRENVIQSQSDLHSTLDSSSVSSLPEDQGHARASLDLSNAALMTTISPVVAATAMSPPTALSFSHGLDTDLHSLPQLSETSFRPIPGIGPASLRTMSPLSLDTGSRLAQQANMEHIQALLTSNRTLQQSVDEKSREIEQQRASVADHKTQLDNYKQQLLVLQQQLGQVSLQQQKQEQDKATASGQQAVLMQLLQQQQGMFSQQQAQIESLSKVGDGHRKEQMEVEVKYKQALAVEQEKNSALADKNTQQGHEIQRLQQQVQAITQQQQMVQMHVYQYQTQIQERDKQLLAFRSQHKEIIQNLEHKYQQKVSQLVVQMQELQGELKKSKSHRQSSLPMPLQPTSVKGLPSQLHQTARSTQHQFLPHIPGTAHQPVDILTPSTSNAMQVGSPRTPHPPQSQVSPQSQGFQLHGSGGLIHHQSSNPVTPQQQLPNPITPQPAQPAAMAPQQMVYPLTPQAATQLSSQSYVNVNQSLPPNQPPGNLGGAQVSNQGSQQQFHSGSLSQAAVQLTTQPGHKMSQPGHVMLQPGHMSQGVPQGMNLPIIPGAGQVHSQLGGQNLAQGSNSQLQSPQSVSQAATSNGGHINPQQVGGFQMGSPRVPTQGVNIQTPPQMQGNS